ncbi:MAG: RpiB/LacA/LacB family sugar-phosphate isomerase [bacterium]
MAIRNMIYLGADHQGFELKEQIKLFLQEQNLEFADCGALVYNKDDDYPDFVKIVCSKMQNNDIAILICATGIGMSIAANKFKNIRAALCCNPEMAKQAREHNNANILCLSKNSDYKNIIKAFLENKFSQEKRHIRRLEKI